MSPMKCSSPGTISPPLIRRDMEESLTADYADVADVKMIYPSHPRNPRAIFSTHRRRSRRTSAPGGLFLPHTAAAVANPARRDDFLLRVELHALFPRNVQIAVEGIIPAGEGEH